MFYWNLTLSLRNIPGIFYPGVSTYIQSVVRNLVLIMQSCTFNDEETSESVELLPLFLDDRKVFTVKMKANTANFWLCGKIDPFASGKWKLSKKTFLSWSFNNNIYFVGKPNGNRKIRRIKITLKTVVCKF